MSARDDEAHPGEDMQGQCNLAEVETVGVEEEWLEAFGCAAREADESIEPITDVHNPVSGPAKGHLFESYSVPLQLGHELALQLVDLPAPAHPGLLRANTWDQLRCPASPNDTANCCQLRRERLARPRLVLDTNTVMMLWVPRLKCTAAHADGKIFSVLDPDVWQQVLHLQSEGKLQVVPAIKVVSKATLLTREAFMCVSSSGRQAKFSASAPLAYVLMFFLFD